MAKALGLFLVFASLAARAAEGHHADGVPGKLVFWQIFNLAVLFGIIYWKTKDSIPEFFRQRKEGFVASAKKSAEAKEEAEKQYLDIKHKLEYLNDSYEESLARAQAEATDLRKQLMSDASDSVRRIKDETDMTIKVELQRAQRDVHQKFVQETVALARGVLSKDIGSSDHQKLQNDFTKNIQAVSP